MISGYVHDNRISKQTIFEVYNARECRQISTEQGEKY